MTQPGLTAGEIAELVGGELVGPPNTRIAGLASLAEAGPGDLAFLASARYVSYFRATRAGAVLLAPAFRTLAGGSASRIVVDDPRRALTAVLSRLLPASAPVWGVAASAVIGRRAHWSGRIRLEAGAILAHDVRLGTDCVVETGAHVGAGAVLGDRCRVGIGAEIGPGAVLGAGVVVGPGARVGTTGFGWVRNRDHYEAMPDLGGVRLGDDVVVGANSTVARGSLGATTIGAGTKIDNLVHVGHNVRVGARCVIMAQAGIAGSSEVEDDVIIAGQAGLADQVHVRRGARVAAQSGVIGVIPAGATVSGYPARDHRSVLRQQAALARLAPLVSRLERLATSSHDDAR